MENEVIIDRLASLLAWRDQVQNMVNPKSKYEYIEEIVYEIEKTKSK